MPIDHPCRVEKVYAMEATVEVANLRIESASGGLDVCDRNEVSRYGGGSDALFDAWPPKVSLAIPLEVADCTLVGSLAAGGPSNVYSDTKTVSVAVSRYGYEKAIPTNSPLLDFSCR